MIGMDLLGDGHILRALAGVYILSSIILVVWAVRRVSRKQ